MKCLFIFQITVPPGVVEGHQFEVIITPPPPAVARAALPTSAFATATPTHAEPTAAHAAPVEASMQGSVAGAAPLISKANPFGPSSAHAADSSAAAVWPVGSIKDETDLSFAALGPSAPTPGAQLSLSPDQVRGALLPLGLPAETLAVLWEQADVDKDGRLDTDEWALAQWLCRRCLAGVPLSSPLDPVLIPPSKRQ